MEGVMKQKRAFGIEIEIPEILINRKPTESDPDGTYKVIDSNGLYWGHWYVGSDWTRTKFVAAADPRDGLPW
jgi:hypothetical protein